MTATDPTLRALAHLVRLRMMNLTRTRPMSGAELAREWGGTACDAGPRTAPDVWDDFRYRLAALLVTLHDAARAPRLPAPRPSPEAEQVGATVMAFPIGR